MRNPSLIFSEILSYIRPDYSRNNLSDQNLLLESVKAFKNNSLSEEERYNIKSIENLRSELLHSTDSIPKEEFGAGSIVSDHQNIATELIRDVCRTSSKPKNSSLLLYHLIRALKPEHAIELGDRKSTRL